MAKRSSKLNSMPATPTVDTDWQSRDDLNTLRRAGEIMSDRPRMSAAQQMHAKEMKGMQKVLGKGPGMSKMPSLNLGKK